MENQAYVFFVFILNGFIIGIVFDFFRIFRKSFKTSDIITYIQDILFWIISGLIILYSLFKFNNGNIRGYIFLGIAIGYLIYYLVFSKIFIRINLYIIKLAKKIVYYFIFLPLKKIQYVLKKLLLKPITFIFINLKKSMSKLIHKCKKIEKHSKKVKNKKDLV